MNIIEKLKHSVASDKPEKQHSPEVLQQWANEYAGAMSASLLRQFTNQKAEEESRVLRLSSIGKPAVLQALNIPSVKLQLEHAGYCTDEETSLRMREIFHRGDQFEAFLLFHLRQHGFDLVSTQETVEFMGVEGHTDAIVSYRGNELLLEVKTMSSNYFNKFVRCPDDERGYLTQLALYSHCTNLPGVWVCIDKGTHNIAVVEPSQAALDKALARAERIIPLFEKIKTFVDVITYFKAPPPVPEIYRRKETGRLLVHPTMKYSEARHLFYHLTTEANGYNKDTEYFVDYIKPDELPEELQS